MNKKTITTIEKDIKEKSIYILTQNENENNNIILHDFDNGDDFFKYLIKKKVQIYIDDEVELPFLKKIKAMMYNMIEGFILESDGTDVFWYRLSGSFVFSVFLFLFFTYIIPDPIPYVDELAISSLGGMLFYLISVKLKLFSFATSKTIEKYTEYIDGITVIFNKELKKINNIFEKYLNKRILEKNIDENISFLKNEIKSLTVNEMNTCKKILKILERNYSFSKIHPTNKKFLKEMNNSPLSKERFHFYYLLYKIIIL